MGHVSGDYSGGNHIDDPSDVQGYGTVSKMARVRNVVVMALLISLAIAPTLVAAAASASPGTTTTIQGMPVIQSFSGLTASTGYDVTLYSPGTNVSIAANVYSDSDGKLTVTIDQYNEFGANSYSLEQYGKGVHTGLTFTINNLNIIPYMVVGLVFVFIGGFFGFFKGALKFGR